MAIVEAPDFSANEVPTSTKMQTLSDAVRDTQNGPGCIVRRIAVQNIPNSAFTDISFDTEAFDNFGMWSSGAATAITLTDDAAWVGHIWCEWASHATGIRLASFNLNASRIFDARVNTTTSSAATGMSASSGFAGTGGGVVTLQVWQNSGGALDVIARLSVFRQTGPVSVFSVS